MAEIFIAGPLLNLGIFLGKWVWRRYKQTKIDKEHKYEFLALLSAVESLAKFAKEKAKSIQHFQYQFGVHSNSLGNSPALGRKWC